MLEATLPSRNNIRLVTLTFLIGMLRCARVFLWINANYEDRLYKRLVSQILVEESSQHDKALALLHAAQKLVKPREAIFAHDYPQEYAYEGVRDTNCSKVPVLMPAIKLLLDALLGEAADEISIRAHVLNLHRVYLWICATLLLVVVLVSIRWTRTGPT